jgi:hypothetical protein
LLQEATEKIADARRARRSREELSIRIIVTEARREVQPNKHEKAPPEQFRWRFLNGG